MMIFFIHKIVSGIELWIVREQRKVQKTDLNGRLNVYVFFPFVEVVERAAEIAKGTFRSVFFINDLHLQIDDAFVPFDPDIEDEFFFVDLLAQLDWVEDGNRTDMIRVKMQQGTEQRL